MGILPLRTLNLEPPLERGRAVKAANLMLLVVAVAVALVGIGGCKKKSPPAGPGRVEERDSDRPEGLSRAG